MPEPLRVGEVVVGKYRIERPLASGGMGVVVCATHLQLNQLVALKFLVDSGLEAHVAAERFLREARATFRLRSEHTVRVMDVGTLPSGTPFIVMELLEGMDFKQLLEQGPLAPATAALYMVQACSALQEAHALGMVHRDLKARNLFLTTRVDGSPCVKVLDFGISKVGEDEAPLTKPDVGMGSPRYMAPEQWASAATVDARADIYAAGAVLYELLTGRIPLAGLPLAEVIKRARAGAIPSPKELRADLPDPICRVVLKALRPRPEERFPTAMHFAQALREAIPDVEHRGRPKPMMAMTVPTAVVSRDVLLARAEIEQRLRAGAGGAGGAGVPQSSAPTPQRAPAPTESAGGSSDFEEDLATIVQRSPMDLDSVPALESLPARRVVPVNQATLQVAEVPPEIQALRDRPIPKGTQATQVSARSLPRPPTPGIPIELAPLPPLDTTLDDDSVAPPAQRPILHMTPSAPPLSAAPSMPMPMPMPMPMQTHSPMYGAPMQSMPMQAPMMQPPAAAPAASPGASPAASKGIPSWLFWTLLVVSFCFAGGVVAALLMRWLQ